MTHRPDGFVNKGRYAAAGKRRKWLESAAGAGGTGDYSLPARGEGTV